MRDEHQRDFDYEDKPTALLTAFQAEFLLGLFIDPKDGGDMFLRNVR
jgi:hypothetical protein